MTNSDSISFYHLGLYKATEIIIRTKLENKKSMSREEILDIFDLQNKNLEKYKKELENK